MNKFSSLLLSLVFSASLAPSAFGDEQLRKLQEELRKRHLFYADTNGEFSPALTVAIARYQKKKGFVVTGIVDRETRESLGIFDPTPDVAPTPFVVSKSGNMHGMNGELLPTSPPLFGSTNSDLTCTDQQPPPVADITVPPSESAEQRIESARPQQSIHRRLHPRPPPPKETNPVVLAYHSMNHAFQWVFGDAPKKKEKKRNPQSRD